jgi:hypothetical protein
LPRSANGAEPSEATSRDSRSVFSLDSLALACHRGRPRHMVLCVRSCVALRIITLDNGSRRERCVPSAFVLRPVRRRSGVASAVDRPHTSGSRGRTPTWNLSSRACASRRLHTVLLGDGHPCRPIKGNLEGQRKSLPASAPRFACRETGLSTERLTPQGRGRGYTLKIAWIGGLVEQRTLRPCGTPCGSRTSLHHA